jgi:Methyltransferase domain
VLKDIGIELAKNIGMGIRPIRTLRLRRARTAPQAAIGDADLERYAFQGLRIAWRYQRQLTDAAILELGPGDHLASGLAMLAAGANSYTSVDRFVGDYSSAQAKGWYAAVENRWPAIFPNIPWPTWLRSRDFPEAYPDRVRWVAAGVEQAQITGPFELVCSFQVVEHVLDVRAVARITATSLADDGMAIHRVDFGPHGRWLHYADPLTFLRFSPRVWKAMGSNRGYPNRMRYHEILAMLRDVGLQVESVESTAISPSTVDLRRLHPRFRHMPTESLLTADSIYLCRTATQRNHSDSTRAGGQS